MMNALFDTTKVVGTLIWEGSPYEVCAEATANHARGGNILTVHLRSFLRAKEQVHLGETLQPDWLPVTQVITEHVEISEAHEVTNEIFASWCRRVVESIPR